MVLLLGFQVRLNFACDEEVASTSCDHCVETHVRLPTGIVIETIFVDGHSQYKKGARSVSNWYKKLVVGTPVLFQHSTLSYVPVSGIAGKETVEEGKEGIYGLG